MQSTLRGFATQPRAWIAIAAGLALLAVLLAPILPDGIDWRLTYRPAALAMLHGQNPFGPEVAPEAPFFAAPWVLILLLPFAFLPVTVGRSILLIVSLTAFVYTAHKLGASLLSTAAFLLAPPIMHSLLNANIEWIPLLGFVLPPQLGLFLVAVKPQTGFAVGVYWLVEAWHTGGWRNVIRVFAPVSIALLISFLLFGLWPLRVNQAMSIAWFNASLWPASIPVGLGLLIASIRKREVRFAMGASPCLSPYVLFHSWSAALAGLLPAQLEFFAAVAGLWILILIRAGVLPF